MRSTAPDMNLIPGLLRLRTLGRLTLLLAACAALYLYAAHNAGRKELRALCEQGVEPKVYRKVSADGYFDGGISCLRNGCWDVLMKSGFRYIEVEQRDADPWDRLSENGYYRLSKVRQDSGLCDARILEEMRESVGLRKYLAGGDCVRVEAIKAPEAQYGVFTENMTPVAVNNIFNSRIRVRRVYALDMKSDDRVYEENIYTLVQNSIPVMSSYRTVLHCGSRGVGDSAPVDVDGNWIESVIKPMN